MQGATCCASFPHHAGDPDDLGVHWEFGSRGGFYTCGQRDLSDGHALSAALQLSWLWDFQTPAPRTVPPEKHEAVKQVTSKKGVGGSVHLPSAVASAEHSRHTGTPPRRGSPGYTCPGASSRSCEVHVCASSAGLSRRTERVLRAAHTLPGGPPTLETEQQNFHSRHRTSVPVRTNRPSWNPERGKAPSS